MKKYNSGEIYFVRECDYPSGQQTNFVKIGLVRYSDNRDSWGRLYEHQTGNPRKLSLQKKHVISTQAVDLVEARLHREFAKKRILGEWFEFVTEAELDSAVKAAKRISKEVDSFVEIFHEASELKWTKSNGDSRNPSADESKWAFDLEVAKAQLKIIKDLESQISDLLQKAHTEGRDISKYSSVTVTNFSPKFMEDEFKTAHPDLWEKYQSTTKDWFNRFTPKCKVDIESDLGSEFYETINGLEKAIDSIKSSDELGEILEPKLELTHLRGIAEWNISTNQALLQIAVGELEGITGICTWKRYENLSTKFDLGKFSSERPEIYKDFIATAAPKTSLKVKKTKS